MAGQFSIGHSLFMALGGTTVGALVSLHGWNVWASVLTAVVLSAALAFVISLMTFSGSVPPLSFALVTLALGEVGLLIVTSSEPLDRKSTRLNSSHSCAPRMPSAAWKKKANTKSR